MPARCVNTAVLLKLSPNRRSTGWKFEPQLIKIIQMPYYIKRKKKASQNESKRPQKRNSQATLIRKLDKLFSLYIRLRDAMPSGYVRCISCGQIKRFEDVDCGHFHSRTHMSTRFDEDNCNAECAYCNRFKADHLIGYQRNLIQKIGQGRFDLLNVRAHSAKHYLDCELEEMIKHYSTEVRRLSTLKGIKVNL